jgi:hypothetical protein
MLKAVSIRSLKFRKPLARMLVALLVVLQGFGGGAFANTVSGSNGLSAPARRWPPKLVSRYSGRGAMRLTPPWPWASHWP